GELLLELSGQGLLVLLLRDVVENQMVVDPETMPHLVSLAPRIGRPLPAEANQHRTAEPAIDDERLVVVPALLPQPLGDERLRRGRGVAEDRDDHVVWQALAESIADRL